MRRHHKISGLQCQPAPSWIRCSSWTITTSGRPEILPRSPFQVWVEPSPVPHHNCFEILLLSCKSPFRKQLHFAFHGENMALKKNSLNFDPKLTNKLIFLFYPLLLSSLHFLSAFLSTSVCLSPQLVLMYTLSTHECAPRERSSWGWENISWLNHGLSKTDRKDMYISNDNWQVPCGVALRR